MHYGVDLGPMGELWREAMQERGGGYSRRTADDDAERSFWREFMARMNMRGQSPRKLQISLARRSMIPFWSLALAGAITPLTWQGTAAGCAAWTFRRMF